MFVTQNQFFVFIACIAFGGAVGIIFSVFSCVKFFIKNKVLSAIPDIIAFIFVGVLYSAYSFALKFPNLRFYMPIGVFIGITMYFKTFHILLAKYAKKFYNILYIKLSLIKKAKDDRNKVKKVNSRNNGRRSSPSRDFANDNGVSVNIHQSSKG